MKCGNQLISVYETTTSSWLAQAKPLPLQGFSYRDLNKVKKKKAAYDNTFMKQENRAHTVKLQKASL